MMTLSLMRSHAFTLTRAVAFARAAAGGAIALSFAASALAADIGQIKVSKGLVTVERDGQSLPGTIGMRLQMADTIKTGADGSVGMTMSDDSLLSAGPNTVLSLDRYTFDPTTNEGRFDTSLSKGALAIISGRIAKQSKDAMTVRTPSAMLGVRGTEFVVRADD
jgi:hypothetical protein